MKAYPNLQIVVSDMGNVRAVTQSDSGMDLRDYFAAKAMQYWLSNPIDNRQIEKLCEGAYQIADAMIKAREK